MKLILITNNLQLVDDINFCLNLAWSGTTVIHKTKGSDGIELLASTSSDLTLADYNLPDMHIKDLVIKVRDFSDIPLIVLMKGQSDIEKAKILEAGADDYINEPFVPIEFIAKIRALFRRTYPSSVHLSKPIIKGELLINEATYEVFLSGTPVKLTNLEYQMLLHLVRNEGRVVTHHSFLKNIWGPEYIEDCEFTKKYICRLRQKLNDDASHPRMILTERGVGYRFICQT